MLVSGFLRPQNGHPTLARAGHLGCPWGKGEVNVVLLGSNFSVGQIVEESNLLMKGPLHPHFPLAAISLVQVAAKHGREHSEILIYFPSLTSFYPIPIPPPPHTQLAILHLLPQEKEFLAEKYEVGRRRQS